MGKAFEVSPLSSQPEGTSLFLGDAEWKDTRGAEQEFVPKPPAREPLQPVRAARMVQAPSNHDPSSNTFAQYGFGASRKTSDGCDIRDIPPLSNENVVLRGQIDASAAALKSGTSKAEPPKRRRMKGSGLSWLAAKYKAAYSRDLNGVDNAVIQGGAAAVSGDSQPDD